MQWLTADPAAGPVNSKKWEEFQKLEEFMDTIFYPQQLSVNQQYKELKQFLSTHTEDSLV